MNDAGETYYYYLSPSSHTALLGAASAWNSVALPNATCSFEFDLNAAVNSLSVSWSGFPGEWLRQPQEKRGAISRL